MKRCMYCGHENDDSVVTCAVCGNRLSDIPDGQTSRKIGFTEDFSEEESAEEDTADEPTISYSVNINGVTKTFTDVPIANGTVGVNVADLPAGNYSVNVTYNGDGNFNPSSAVANFSVSKASPVLNVYR